MQPGQPVQGMPLRHKRLRASARHRRRFVGSLVLGQDVDAALMARLFRPLGRQERVDNGESFRLGVHAAADPDQLRVVVLARQHRGLQAPRQRTAGTRNLVGGNLLTVTRTAQHNAEAARIGDGAPGRIDTERRVIVLRVQLKGTTVHRLVTAATKMLDDLLLQLVSGVIGSHIDAHAPIVTAALCQVALRSVTVARMYPVGLPQYTYPPRRHPWEIGLLVVVILFTVLLYVGAIFGIISFLADPEHVQLNIIILALAATPLTLFIGRGILYGQQRVNGVKMSPTQFPEGYAMVVEAAQRFGLHEIPDAYVVLGNGQINAFASGHGFRRFVVVYSDLFEIGGDARDPEALAFIIGHEVGHIAAGHASYWRQFAQTAMNFVPFLGTSLSRSMEYTADNHGYSMRPTGIQGAIGVMAAGKYLLKRVEFDTLANRATLETGFFVWLVNMLSSHPVHTWRAAALRNRQQAGSLFFRPKLLPPTPIPPVPPVLPPAPPPIPHGYMPLQQGYTFDNPPPRY